MRQQKTGSPSHRIHVVEDAQPNKRGVMQCPIGSGKNLSFDMEDLASYCFAEWEPLIFDALLLAAAVEFCDRTLYRRSEQWARKIRLQIPVHSVGHWRSKEVVDSLVDALNFLSGDLWTLDFQPRKRTAERPLQRPLSLPVNAKAVVPFSDGLDSWAVAQIVRKQSGAEPICVRLSSRKAGRKPSDPRQPFAFVPYKVKARSNNQPLTTGRHRGFKFTMISAIAAYMSNVDTVIVPESGQGALGPALAPVGPVYPDYRSHPLFTMRMERFLAGLFGRPIRYDFPRLWNTKGETLRAATAETQDIQNVNGWKGTRSCWQGNRRAGIDGVLRQCGVCAACILRRLSVHAAELEEDRKTYVWEDLAATTFRGGANSTFSKSIKPFREYAIAGVSHMDHLAELVGSIGSPVTLRRHAFEVAQWRGDPPYEIEGKLRGLLEQHAKEWTNFVLSLGSESFARPWARTVA
jgi:7-cyano-7-deazaguanine synthase in queuosine biosynthesis